MFERWASRQLPYKRPQWGAILGKGVQTMCGHKEYLAQLKTSCAMFSAWRFMAMISLWTCFIADLSAVCTIHHSLYLEGANRKKSPVLVSKWLFKIWNKEFHCEGSPKYVPRTTWILLRGAPWEDHKGWPWIIEGLSTRSQSWSLLDCRSHSNPTRVACCSKSVKSQRQSSLLEKEGMSQRSWG